MDQPSPPADAPLENPQEPPMSLASRLFNVLAAPGEVFEQVVPRPVQTANWLVPALLFILVSWLGLWLVMSQDSIRHQLSELADQAMQAQPQGPHMTEQQILVFSIVAGVVSPVLIGLLTPFFWGLILWLVGTKILKGSFTYMKAVEVAGLADMIAVLEAIVKTLLIVVTGNVYASTSLAMLIKNFNMQNPLHALAIYVNLMMFWLLLVRAVGLARFSRISFVKATIWVFGIWIAYNSFCFSLSQGFQALVKKLAPH